MDRRSLIALALLVGLASTPSVSPAQVLHSPAPVLDQIEIVFLERDVLALGAAGGDARVRLDLDEQVLFHGARGIAGAVVTNRRLLLVSAGGAAFREVPFLREELPPDAGPLLGERVVLLRTSRRLLGFSGTTGRLSEYRIGPNETLDHLGIAEGVAIGVTSRKALGFSARTGGFFEIALQVRETIEAVDVRAELATVTTNRRLLVFRGLGGAWGERRRQLGS